MSAFWRVISHELDLAAVVLVVDREPLGQICWLVFFIDGLKKGSGFIVSEQSRIASLIGFYVEARNNISFCVSDRNSHVIEFLHADDLAYCPRL